MIYNGALIGNSDLALQYCDNFSLLNLWLIGNNNQA
jgi:hypothetical protein